MKYRSVISRILLAALALSLLLGATACKKNPFTEKSLTKLSDYDDYKIDMTVDVVRNRKIEVTVTNNSEHMYDFGHLYQLEYKFRGSWYRVPLQAMFTLEAIVVDPGCSWTDTYYLTEMHGDLPAGHYRIVKDVTYGGERYYFAAEFDLKKAVDDTPAMERSTLASDQILPLEDYTLPVSDIRKADAKNLEFEIKLGDSARDFEFSLEYQQDGEWYSVPLRGANSSYGAGEELFELYLQTEGPLPSGRYRLLREIRQDGSGRTIYGAYEFNL